MNDDKIRILATNDDGIDSPGLLALVNEMKKLGEVTVAAPKRQQSAVSHALNIANPLRIKEIQKNGSRFGFAINGTPADCVKIALANLLDFKPDLIVSGINHGQNTSVNIMYSGTIAGAAEGMLLGIPSIAVSLDSHNPDKDCSVAAEYALYIAKNIIGKKLPPGTLLNVNVPAIPANEIKGIKITRQGGTIWKDRYDKRTDPFGRDYYWFAGEFALSCEEPDTDEYAVANSYVSVTPVHFNLTNYEAIQNLKYLENDL